MQAVCERSRNVWVEEVKESAKASLVTITQLGMKELDRAELKARRQCAREEQQSVSQLYG